MKDEDRRNILKALSDDQYADVIRVCASMPLIDFKVMTEVLDDEESAVVTAGAIVTVTVTLTRNSMGSLLKGESAAMKSSQSASAAVQEDPEEDKENREVDGEANNQVQNKKPVWQKKKGGAKKAAGKGKQQPKKNAVLSNNKPTKPTEASEKPKELKELPDTVDDSDDDGASDGSMSDSDSGSENADKDKAVSGNEDDDDEWEKCQTRLAKNKERALEGKSKLSHPVHCPYFPEVKNEYWWTYVSDRKNKQLVTAPFFVTNLVRQEECQLQFTAPRKPGHYKFTVCLRSDSFLGFDQMRDIKLDVQEAKHIEEHPQWEMSDEEEEKEVESEESEYATDDDEDAEQEEDSDE
jgi:translocation protein SEC63